MAREVVVAVKDGNWSDPTTWNTGTLPDSTDQVFSNGYIVTIDQDVTVKFLSNGELPVSEVPYMTSMTEPSGEVIFGQADFYPNPDRTDLWPYQAFANDYINGSQRWYANQEDNNYIGYDFGEAIIISGYSTSTNGTYRANDFGLEAWDGSQWIRLHSIVGGNSSSYKIHNVGNTTAYTKYRWYSDVGNSSRLEVYSVRFWYSQATNGITSGGKFIASDNITINVTDENGLVNNNYSSYYGIPLENIIEYYGNGFLNINTNIYQDVNSNTSTFRNAIRIEGDGVVNFTGTTNVWNYETARSNTFVPIYINSTSGVLNIVGEVQRLLAYGSGTINITGDITYTGPQNYTNSIYGIQMYNTTTLNITGDIYFANTENNSRSNWSAVFINDNVKCYHTGALYNIDSYFYSSDSYVHQCVRNEGYYNQIGLQSVQTRKNGICLLSTYTAKNILSGPFLSDTDGSVPFAAYKVFLQRNDTYFQFKDNSTDGYYDYANPNEDQIDNFTLYSAISVVDLPSEEDVRLGTEYGNQNYTGTLAVPLPSQVSLGIATDDTTGTAVLSASDVWSEQISNITTSGSIGERLKNASTVESTGDQLESFL